MQVSTLVLIACALAAGLVGGIVNGNDLETAKRCASEVQLGDIPIKELFKHNEEPNKKIKCFVACMARENDVIVHGKFSKEKIFAMLPANFPHRDKAVEIVAKCSDQVGSDDCETAYLCGKCLGENKIPPPFLPESN